MPVVTANNPPTLNRAAVRLYGEHFATILLSDEADVSSVIHEGAHIYLEIYDDLAKQPEAELSLKEDLATLLVWFGVNENQWRAMSLDGKRRYHEQFAESFEQYMAEGLAPSLALAREFNQFQGWLGDVYGSIQDHLPNARLNDDIRAVFDRMLTSANQRQPNLMGKIYHPVFQQLVDIGVDETVAHSQAAIFQAAYRSFIARSGMSANDFLNRYHFTIEAADKPLTEASDMILERAHKRGFNGDSVAVAAGWLAAESKGLDLSLQARRKRAEQQGYDINTVYYHGTGVDFDRFQLNPKNLPYGVGSGHPSGKLGFWFTPQPELASYFASWSGIGDNAATVYPVYLKPGKQKVYEFDARFLTAVNEKNRLQTLYTEAMENQVYNAQAPILNDMRHSTGIFKNLPFGDMQKLYRKTLDDIEDRVTQGLSKQLREAQAKVKHLEDNEPGLCRDPFHQFMDDLGYAPGYGYKVDWQQAREHLLAAGYTSVLIRNTEVDTENTELERVDQVLVLDPTAIRSVHAAFDPDEAHSSRLLAQPTLPQPVKSDILNAAAKGLPMDQHSRLMRAEALGFDTRTIWYHGSFSAFDEFDPDKSGTSGFHFSKNRFFAENYATQKAIDGGLDADTVTREFYLRGELFDFNDSTHIDRLRSVLPEELSIQGRYGWAAWCGKQDFTKTDLLEAVQGIQTPHTGLDHAAKAAIRSGKKSFVEAGSTQIVVAYDKERDLVHYAPLWEVDRLNGLKSRIAFLRETYGENYSEIPLVQSQLDRVTRAFKPISQQLEPEKTPGHDNWSVLESSEIKPYLQAAGFSGALLQEKRATNAVVFDAHNIRDIDATFDPDNSKSAKLYTQSAYRNTTQPEAQTNHQRARRTGMGM